MVPKLKLYAVQEFRNYVSQICLLLKHIFLLYSLYAPWKKWGFNLILKKTSKIGEPEAVVPVFMGSRMAV